MSFHVIFDCDGTLVDTSQANHSIYPEIKSILNCLSQYAELSVWTARDRRSTLRLLTENQIIGFFQGILTCDDAYPKPHSKGLEELTLGTEKKNVFVVGDSSMDILGAKNFGSQAIGAIWNGRSSAELLLASGADFVASSPQDCLEWILGQMINT